MDNKQYQALGMSQHMLREFQAQRKANVEAAHQQQAVFAYQQFNSDVLSYPIFSNRTCSTVEATALRSRADDLGFCQRWRFFYEPETEKLPQNDYQQGLEAHTHVLEQRLRSLNSPRLAIFAATFLLVIWLMARGHFLLVAFPIIGLVGYWLFAERKIRQVQAQLKHHYAELEQFLAHRAQMAAQLSGLPLPAAFSHFQQLYQRAIQQLFAHTVAQVLAEHEYADITQVLKKQGWQGFIGESWGYLQPHQPFTDKQHIALSAFCDDPTRKGHTLFRLQYLQVWVATQRGLLLGQAYYDRVADQFLYEQHEFFSYAELRHVMFSEQILDAPALHEQLPSDVYERFFHKPTKCLRLTTASGQVLEFVALPSAERPLRQTVWKDQYGLNGDLEHLNRCLHEWLYPREAAA